MIPDSPGAARCPGESFFIGCRKTAHGEELRVFRLHTIRFMSAVREDTERKDENAEDSAGYGYRRRHRRRGLLGVPAARAAVRAETAWPKRLSRRMQAETWKLPDPWIRRIFMPFCLPR